MNNLGFFNFLIPDPIWRWDNFTHKYDNEILGRGQYLLIRDKLIMTAQHFVKQVFSHEQTVLTAPRKRKARRNESKDKQGWLERDGIYCRYIFKVGLGDHIYTFTVKNIPVSSDTEKVKVFFESLLDYISSAYISVEANLSYHKDGHLLASHKLMRLADAFLMSFQKSIMLEYLYSILNYDLLPISSNASLLKDANRYNLQLLETIYDFGMEISSRRIENKDIYTGFIFHSSEVELLSNSIKCIRLSDAPEFGSFQNLKSLISASNGRNVFFNVTGNRVTHLFVTRENVTEIAMEPFVGGKTFTGKPLILSIQGNGKVLFLQGDVEQNRILFQITNSRVNIKDYRFIENYLDKFFKDVFIYSDLPCSHFVKWLLKFSSKKKGTTVIIGNFNKSDLKYKLVSYNDISIDSSLVFSDDRYSLELLDSISNPDGALIFDEMGILLFMSAILPFSKGKKIAGGGARHQSTINFTRSNRCIGITVSEDGGITIFNKGKIEIRF